MAERLDIPFYAINFEEEFGRIIHYFIASTPSGRTPNPCVVCNTWLKFGKLLDYADSVGAAEIATGHYARLVKTADGRTGPLPRARSGQGPVLRALGHSARGARPVAVSRGRLSQGGNPPHCRAARPAPCGRKAR